jgi:hypothetical protein
MLEEKLEDENAVAEGDSSSRSSFGGVMDKLSSYMPSISIPAISAQDVQAAYQERLAPKSSLSSSILSLSFSLSFIC